MTVTYIWLITGLALIAADVLGITGVGLLFAGLGALVVGALISFHLVEETAQLSQWIIFFIATAGWAALLWSPMQRFRVGKQAPGYRNMVGETAFVGSSGLSRAVGGEATWSGTIMKAELAHDAGVEKLEAGSPVVIVDVTGAKLIVKPK